MLAATLCAPLATASAQVSGASSLALNRQSTWVSDGGSFALRLAISSPDPPSGLGVQVTVDSKLTSRTAFDVSLTGAELPQESCLDRSAVLPLTGFAQGPTTSGFLALRFPVNPAGGSPTCAAPAKKIDLDCASGPCIGVYPVKVALVSTASGALLASFTTYLVELPRGRLDPLGVALVLSLGTTPAVAPNGSAEISSAELASIAQLVALLASYPHLHASLVIYPQLLVALKRDGTAGAALLASLDSLVTNGRRAGTLRLLDAPFVQLDASTLTASGLGRDLTTALQRGDAELASQFGFKPVKGEYVAPGPLDSAGLALLEQNCIHELVLPEIGVASNAIGLTQTAPYVLPSTQTCEVTNGPAVRVAAVGVGADPAGALFAHPAADSVLAAHQLLAELAQVYFDAPYAAPRGVALAPTTASIDPTFLGVLLAGLSSSPAPLTAESLSALFSTPVGSNSNVASEILPSAIPQLALPSGAIAESDRTATAVESTVPQDRGLIDTLAQSRLIALGAGLSTGDRARYLDAPDMALTDIRHALSLSGTNTVTITQQTGRIPITIHSGGSGFGSMDVRIALSSSKLVLSAKSQRVTLAAKDTPVRVKVTTRSSGDFSLAIELLTPKGGDVLLQSHFAVRSTAVSGVGIGLSIGALVVLLGWWVRSGFRRRRTATRGDAAMVTPTT